MKVHRSLIQIDTSNPPGNETKAAEYLKKVFDAEGIPAQIFALDPARANVVARLKGNGSKRPILILGHTDVVGVQREKWPVDPFAAVLKDGYIWGRGSNDDKDKVASNLMTMLLLKRTNARLDRDVIFLAESGEEGTTGPGIDFMVSRHFDAIDAEFAISSYIWMVKDGMVLDPMRHRYILEQLNVANWPFRYRELERLAKFENTVFAKYARVHGLPFIDSAGQMPLDPDLFIDAVHGAYSGIRLHGWIMLQRIIPIIEKHLADAPGNSRPALCHPQNGQKIDKNVNAISPI